MELCRSFSIHFDGSPDSCALKVKQWDLEPEVLHVDLPEGEVMITEKVILIKTGFGELYLHFPKSLLEAKPMYPNARREIKVIEVQKEGADS